MVRDLTPSTDIVLHSCRRACPIGALSMALRAADEEATWWGGAYLATAGLALHAVLLAVLVGAVASRRDLQRLLTALPWPLCVAAVAGSSWHALPAALCVLPQSTAASLVVVRCGSAMCNMLLLAPAMLRDGGLTRGLLLAMANALFSVGRGDGPLLYLAGLPPLPGAMYVRKERYRVHKECHKAPIAAGSGWPRCTICSAHAGAACCSRQPRSPSALPVSVSTSVQRVTRGSAAAFISGLLSLCCPCARNRRQTYEASLRLKYR